MVTIDDEIIQELQNETIAAEELLQQKSEKLKELCEIGQSLINEIDALRDELWDVSINMSNKVDEIKQAIIFQ